MRRLSRSDSNKRGTKLTLKRQLTLERLENRSLLAGFPIAFGDGGGTSLATDSLGNVFVGGQVTNTVDFDPGPGIANISSINSKDGFLAKYSSDSSLVWARRFGGNKFTYPSASLTVDTQGNTYLVGSFQGTTSFTGINRLANGSNAPYTSSTTMKSHQNGRAIDGLVVNFDPFGSVQWARQFGGDNGQASVGNVEVHTNAGVVDAVYVIGSFSGTVDFNPATATTNNLLSAGGNDGFVVKLDGAGNFLWAKRAGSTGNDNISDIAVAADGSVYATGAFEGTNPFGSGANIALTSQGGQDGFVASLSSSGTVNWVKSMGGAAGDRGNGISVWRDVSLPSVDYVYVTGGFGSGAVAGGIATFGGVTLTSLGYQDGFVSKMDSTGTFHWTKQIGGADNQGTKGPAIDPNSGDLYLTGYFISTVDFDPGAGAYLLTPTDVQDGYVAKLDKEGNFRWATQLKGPESSNGIGIAWDPFSTSVFATGYFLGTLVASTQLGSFGPTLSTSNNNGAAFVVKLAGDTGLPPSSLNAAAAAPAPMAVSDSLSLSLSQVSPIFDAALAKWQATGADVSSLLTADIRVANLGGSLLGLASGNTITLDDNAAGWGWYIDSTPSDDSEFLGADNQGEMHRMDLLSVLMHEMGHLLGHDHDDEGVMAETLAAGTRSVEREQVHVAATDLAFGGQPDFDSEFTFAKAKRRR